MADEAQDADEQRRQLEEFQRQQAAAAVEASRNQPNAIPPERAVDRTVAQTFTARGLPVPTTVNAPSSVVGVLPTQDQQRQFGIGSYIDQFGDTVGGATQDLAGYHQPMPQGAVGVQGNVSPQEQQFWEANPNGAVKDPVTGNLIGLGDTPTRARVADQFSSTYQGFGSGRGAPSPGTPGVESRVFNPRSGEWEGGSQPQRPQSIDDFIDPAIENRRSEIANERATIMEHLSTASRQRAKNEQLSPWEAEYHKLQAIDHADSVLQKEQLGRAHLKAAASAQSFNEQRQLDTVNQVTGFYSALSNVTSPIGTPEHAQEIAAIASQFPLAMHDEEARRTLSEHSQMHDNAAELAARLAAQGLTVTPKSIGAKGGVSYSVATPKTIEGEAGKKVQENVAKGLTTAGITPEEFAARTNERATNNKTDPESGRAKDGQFIAFDVGGKTHVFDRASFENANRIIPKPQAESAATPGTHGYDIGAQYGNMIYQGGDPNVRSSWKSVQEAAQ